MKKIFTTLLVMASLILTACPKANETIRAFKDNSAKAKIYGNKIRAANRASFDAKDLSLGQFKFLTAATKKFRDAVKALDAGIEAADAAIRGGGDRRSALDALDRILSQQVVTSFDEMVAALTGVHIVTNEVSGWISTIRIALAAIRALFADARGLLDGGGYVTA